MHSMINNCIKRYEKLVAICTLFNRLRSFLKGHYLSIKVQKFWEDELYIQFLSLLNKLQNNFYDQQLHQNVVKLRWNSLWKEHSLTCSLKFWEGQKHSTKSCSIFEIWFIKLKRLGKLVAIHFLLPFHFLKLFYF